jgi:hypothetical protein
MLHETRNVTQILMVSSHFDTQLHGTKFYFHNRCFNCAEILSEKTFILFYIFMLTYKLILRRAENVQFQDQDLAEWVYFSLKIS